MGVPPFSLQHTDTLTAARVGILRTPHGEVPTPVFMPVGTQATVKTLTPNDLLALGARIILANTYHLALRPGADAVRQLGGLHRFTGWRGPILTDSGGFQVFSLGERRRVTDDGVYFTSHLDERERHFTPAGVMDLQENLGADVVMAFDECAPYPCDRSYLREAMERTHRWAAACRASQTRADQLLFGIVQGGTDPELRRESAAVLGEMDLPGYAIGGLSVGEPKELMHAMLEETVPLLPVDRPRYLMGVGSPEDLLEGVARGIDLFDCVLPTRIARNGACFTPAGRLNLRKAAGGDDDLPLQEGCDCQACQGFSRAYLRHLFRAEEPLAHRLVSLHNLRFLVRLLEQARSAIAGGRFQELRREFVSGYAAVDPAARRHNREARQEWYRRRRTAAAALPRSVD